jgi:heme/copper-type cytochrome/quinol oxidase subunit 2
MLRLYTTLTIAWFALSQRLLRPPGRKDERGSVTIENVLWAVAVIAIVAIVVAAIRAFVTSESGKIR